MSRTCTEMGTRLHFAILERPLELGPIQSPDEVMIVSLIELRPSPGKRAEILELLRYSADHVGTKAGALGSRVYEGNNGEETILYVERWRREEDFRQHVQSNLYLGVLTALDLAMDRREVNFYEVSDTKSMEFIVAVRNSN